MPIYATCMYEKTFTLGSTFRDFFENHQQF